MPLSDAYNFVAGDEFLELHKAFSFTDTVYAAADQLPQPAADNAEGAAVLSLSGAEFLEGVRGEPVGWFSPSAADSVDDINAIRFEDFFDLDGSADSLPTPAEVAPLSPQPEVTDSNTLSELAAATSEPGEDLATATQLETAQAEIALLKAALAAVDSSTELLPGGRQSSSSPQKRKSIGGEEGSPPKRQMTTQMGPIEALWSSKVTEDERRAFKEISHSPKTPKTSSTTPRVSRTHLDFTTQSSNTYINEPQDLEISAEDLQSIEAFICENPDLGYGTSDHIDATISPPNIAMAHPVNMKVKRAPAKRTPKPSPKSTTPSTSKVSKKTKTTSKKPQHQRTASAATHITVSPNTPPSHRNIDELLAANFYSLNEQEKCRVLLPMLRNLDPRELEASLAELPCIQAKGPGHEFHVARAIRDSPPTPEADDSLATRLTTGTPTSPSPAPKVSTSHGTSAPTAALQSSPVSHNIGNVEVSTDHGAIRQREALEKAALTQADGMKE